MQEKIDRAEIKAKRSYSLRYKRPALASMGYEAIIEELWNIQDSVSNVVYYMEDKEDETLLNALNGDEEAEWEFRLVFAQLEGKLEELQGSLEEARRSAEWIFNGSDFQRIFDDCLVALIGNRYNLIGAFQDVDGSEDYVSLTGYQAEIEETEAGKRLMRATKAQILSTIGVCLGILISFLDLRQQYDYLKATLDILRDENTSLLQTVKEIDRLYDEASEEGVNSDKWKQFDLLLAALPDRTWLE